MPLSMVLIGGGASVDAERSKVSMVVVVVASGAVVESALGEAEAGLLKMEDVAGSVALYKVSGNI